MKNFYIILFSLNNVKCNHKYTETNVTCDFKDIEKYIPEPNDPVLEETWKWPSNVEIEESEMTIVSLIRPVSDYNDGGER